MQFESNDTITRPSNWRIFLRELVYYLHKMNQESDSLQPIQEEALDENGEAIVREVASRP